jgi:hypothetical protein
MIFISDKTNYLIRKLKVIFSNVLIIFTKSLYYEVFDLILVTMERK